MDWKKVAEEAFNAYGDDAEWLTFDGRKMPDWNSVGEVVQSHWTAAVIAAVEFYISESNDS